MQRTLMSSKIHRAVVTDANLHYIGSIPVDGHLMDLAGSSMSTRRTGRSRTRTEPQ